jgi:hypothetical protein
MIERLMNIAAFRFIFSFIATLASLVFVLVLSRYGLSRSLPKLRSNCIILGNGPSLRSALNESAELISNCDIVVTNDFPNTPEFHIIKPQYYYLIDNAFFMLSRGCIISLRTIAICEALQSVDWDIHVFVPRKFKLILESNINNKRVKFYYFNLTPCDGFDGIRFLLFRYGLALPYANNVLIPALIHSINSGYSNIYIYGVEHNWTSYFTLDEDNRLCMSGQHFFSETQEKPRVWWKNQDVSLLVHEALYALSLTFRAYHVIARYSKKKNVRIYNCTNNSLIDAFPKFSIGKC